MSNHTPKYLNNILIGPCPSIWAHIFQPRQFQGKGDPRYDVSLVLNPQQVQEILPKLQQLAVEAFPAGEHQFPNFQWPMTQTEQKLKTPKLAEVFPGHYLMSAKAYEDRPPQVLVPNAPGQTPAYVPMPDTQRATLVYDGAQCYATIDFASYSTGTNVGIRVQLAAIVFWGAGDHIQVGSRPDAAAVFEGAGLNIQMQTPAPLQQQMTPTPGGGIIPQGVPEVQPMPGSQQVTPQQPPHAQPAQAANPFAPPPVDFTKQ